MPEPETSLYQLVDQYLNYLIVEKGLATLTIESYAGDLRLFVDFLLDSKIKTIQQAETAVLLKHIIELRRIGLGPRTRARHLVAIRGFYDFLSRSGAIKNNHPTKRGGSSRNTQWSI